MATAAQRHASFPPTVTRANFTAITNLKDPFADPPIITLIGGLVDKGCKIHRLHRFRGVTIYMIG